MQNGQRQLDDRQGGSASYRRTVKMEVVSEQPGIEALLREARTDFEELKDHGRMQRAADLAEASGENLAADRPPMYFGGRFDAAMVMIHLNPKLSDRMAVLDADFEQYVDRHRRFGHHHWKADPTYRSAFDHKQVRFLRPFGTINFADGNGPAIGRRNAAMALDEKLQLELVPYASPSFNTHRFTAALLRPHFERVLDAVSAHRRRYVLFCGAVFDELLDRSGLLGARRDHRFALPTLSGTSTSRYRFSNVVVRRENLDIRAGVARSFATQGIPMAAYGEKVKDLYDCEL